MTDTPDFGRLNVRLPQNLMDRVDAVASAKGLSRTAFLRLVLVTACDVAEARDFDLWNPPEEATHASR